MEECPELLEMLSRAQMRGGAPRHQVQLNVHEEEDYGNESIDINSLPNDQQQYFLNYEYNPGDEEEEDEKEGLNVVFRDSHCESQDQSSEEDDIGEDLIEVYRASDNAEEDLLFF